MPRVYTNIMKTSIHPNYNQITVTCNSCNTSFTTHSTNGTSMTVDVCSNCHPFFTGTQKIVDVANKARDFANRQAAAKKLQDQIATIKEEKAKRLNQNTPTDSSAPATLKDMMKLLKSGK